MDHDLAVKSHACEKYLLGELSPELREAYEEHYFSCAECAAQLRLASEFVAASQQILAAAAVPAAKPGYVRPSRGWSSWLKPVFAIPALALLLLVLGYQNFVTIPQLKESATPHVLQMFSLISANTRGDEALLFSVTPGEPFGLYVDVPADSSFSSYLLRLEDPIGRSTPLRSLTAEQAQKTQVITINPGKRAGKYAVVVSGVSKPGAGANELARLQFTVEFIK